jgi:acyl-CoA thioesterase-1
MTKLKFLPTLALLALLATTAVAFEKDRPAKPPVIPPNPNHLPQVLLIGDSISGGYHKLVVKLLEGKAVVAKSSDNGESTAVGVIKIDGWLGTNKWDVIHFNWGLWDMYGWQYAADDRSPAKYAERLEALVTRLEKTGAKLIWATTTPACPGPERAMRDRFKQPLTITPEIQKQYHDAALQVMKKHRVAINDLYALLQPELAKYQNGPDDVHFNGAGSQRLAQQVAEMIRKELDAKK